MARLTLNLHLPIILFASLTLALQLQGCQTNKPMPAIETPVAINAENNSSDTKTLQATNIVSTPTTIPQILDLSRFMITPKLCGNDQGPDCTKLRLGDDYLDTNSPGKGYLYSCSGKNPRAPGSTSSKITWIDIANNRWNILRKPWLPSGTFNPDIGTYEETISNQSREIKINNLPVDGKIGDWPMTNYAALTDIDRNPGTPAMRNSSFLIDSAPVQASSPSCISFGAIGVTKNGVVIYNAADARGEDAVAREILDIFGGHPAMEDYHYHFIPERLDDQFLNDGHSGIVGYINDGFPINGYRGEEGVEMSNEDLDICHGHTHGELGYHYHSTIEYPYTVGCYMGATRTVSAKQPSRPRR